MVITSPFKRLAFLLTMTPLRFLLMARGVLSYIVLSFYLLIVSAISFNMVKATWDPIVTKSGFQVRYQLFDGKFVLY
jgi:hypothetical protein